MNQEREVKRYCTLCKHYSHTNIPMCNHPEIKGSNFCPDVRSLLGECKRSGLLWESNNAS